MNSTPVTNLRALRTPAPVRVCPRCHGDCYIAVGDGERRCPSCRGTGVVAD